jgi:peroxiredoxin
MKSKQSVINQVLLYLLLLGCSSLFAGCSSVVDEDDAVERVHVGDRVPLFSLTVTDGQQERTFTTAQLTGETVIVFFNTSCADCQRDLPLLNTYYLQHKDDKGFRMVAISREEDEASIAAFWQANHLQIPYFAQTDRRIYNLFATSIIPRIYFVSAEGIVTRIDVEKFGG